MEIALVHRPNYDDWTIPKGKEDAGEDSGQTALREVHEETGFLCRITGPPASSTYAVAAGMKQVEYFPMRPYRFTGFEPNDEVDEVRWIRVTEAPQLLTYDFDRELAVDLDPGAASAHTSIHLVRHGDAGDRSKWERRDEDRPLTAKGFEQATAVALGLAGIGIDRVLSSPYLRCLQTVTRLAETLGLYVEPDQRLAEGADSKSISSLLDEVGGTNSVLCSHGDVIPASLESLRRRGVRFNSPYECRKASTWSIGHDGEDFIDAVYLPPPNE